MMQNLDIRKEVQEAGLYLWQIADKLGMDDCNFSRKLRKEFTPDKKAQIRAIIAELKAGEPND